MRTLIEQITENTVFSLLIQMFGWLAFNLAPVSTSMWVVLGLIISDLVFGIWATVFKKKKPFSSRAMRRTLGKIFIYEFIVIWAFVLEKNVWPDQHLISGAMSFISVVESISILENLRIITGIDIWAFIFHRINKNSNSGKFLFRIKQNARKNKKKIIKKKVIKP